MYFLAIQCKMRMRLKPLFLWTILIVGMTVLVVAEGTKTNRHHIILKKLFKDKNLGKLLFWLFICRDLSRHEINVVKQS